MKKWLSLTLVIVMVLLTVACGNGENPGEKAGISRGTIDGDVYTNEFLGFTFTKPASWVFSTDEEIAALVNLSVENILGDNFSEALKTNQVLYDMMVIDSVTRTNINIGYENLAMSQSTNITMEQYINAFKSQLENVSGMTVTFPETYDSVTLGDSEFTRIVCTTQTQGVSMTQVYYLQKVESYMCTLIVTIPGGYTVEQIEAMFE